MIRTLIVDDEYLIRYGIRQAVDWNALGYEIIGEAENGQDALTQIKNLHPDLVMLDINLPIINGIEVCRQINELHLNTEIIILTGYDDFKYIQTCLRLGVLNYVVKPLETEELTAALQKAKQTITVKKNLFRQPEPGVQTPDQSMQNIYEKVNKILSEQSSPVYVAFAEADYLKRKNPSANAQSVVINCITDGISRFSEEQSVSLLCARYENQIILYFLEELPDVLGSAKKLQEYLYLQLDLSVSIGLCTVPLAPGQMQDCIEIALDALALKFHFGTMSLYQSSARSSQNPSLEINSSRLYSFLLKAQDRQFLEYIDETLTKAMEIQLSKNNYILLCAGIINTVLNYSAAQSISLTPSQTNQFSISTYLDYFETAAEIKTELMEACAGFVFQFIKKPLINPLIREVIRYVDTNYTDTRLSSGNIARALSVSPNYLSKIFRQELNLTITEYITQKRIAEAVNLLEHSGNLSITEIAHRVGYSDSFYFSKIFHKLKGISPSKYAEIENAKKEQYF